MYFVLILTGQPKPLLKGYVNISLIKVSALKAVTFIFVRRNYLFIPSRAPLSPPNMVVPLLPPPSKKGPVGAEEVEED